MTVELYLGDCMEILQGIDSDIADIVITSPPYNIKGGQHKSSGMLKEIPRNITRDWYEDDLSEEDYQIWMSSVVSELLRITRGLVWINHKVRYADRKAIHPARFLDFPLYSEVIWDRGGSITLNARKFAPSYEVIYGFGEPNYWNNDANKLMSVWRIAPSRNNGHPCAFPLQIPLRLINASCELGGTVLDPFMGSGTTGVACMQTGHNFIGIELDPKYYELAEKRIAKAQLQIRMEI